MNLSKHAAVRCQQRGIPPLVISWLRTFGKEAFDHHGAVTRYLDKGAKKALARAVGSQVIRQLEPYLNMYLVESVADGGIITTGHLTKRINRV